MDTATVVEQQRRIWDQHSAGWGRWDDLVSRMLGPITDTMLRLLEPDHGGHHLDVACGTGEPGIDIAASRGGRVALADLSSGMLDQARRKAADRGIVNIEFHVSAVDELPFPDDSFDTVTCRLGMMFFPDPVAAAAELRRVLRPSGRICAAVWSDPEGNPWATVPMEAIASEIDLRRPPADAPGLFRFATPGTLAGVFERAGYDDVREMQTEERGEIESAEQFWTYTKDVAGPIVAALDGLDAETEARITERVMAGMERYRDGARVVLPMQVRFAVRHGARLTARSS